MFDPSNKIKILLVDDDEMIRIYFRDIFWIHGLDNKYDLTTVESPQKAEAIISDPKTRPHIIFTDLVMPAEKDGRIITSPEAGLNFLKKIKTDPELKDVKVIVFSGHSEDTLKKQVKELGAENYMIKSDNLPKDLIEYVEKMIGK
ncbi:MAG: response regulator [Patescibacteria group bacterium]